MLVLTRLDESKMSTCANEARHLRGHAVLDHSTRRFWPPTNVVMVSGLVRLNLQMAKIQRLAARLDDNDKIYESSFLYALMIPRFTPYSSP